MTSGPDPRPDSGHDLRPNSRPGRAPQLALAAGLLLTGAAVAWLGGGLALAAFVAGLLGLSAVVWLATARRGDRTAGEIAPPDWSVTVAAIEHRDVAVAITDRANRLVCANALYRDWAGVDRAPPGLDLPRPGMEALARIARDAWRGGAGQADEWADAAGRMWSAEAVRSGRGDDHLVWRFTERRADDLPATLAGPLAGGLGMLMSRAGLEGALVDPDGAIRAVTPGFARRATGDAGATMAGQDFAQQLRTDDADRLYFAREGRGGAQLALVHVPLGDPQAADVPGAADAPSLMLLLEPDIAIGGALGGDNGAGAPQLEALLAALPLGLAMVDRDGRTLFANQAFHRAAGLEGKPLPPYPSDLVVREDKAAMVDAVRRYGRGPAASGDLAFRLRPSPDEPVSLGVSGVRGLGEAAVLLSLTDSTEETRLKRQVAQATKMQAVGQLAGGVAHDFNNVLTAILGTCDLMLMRHMPGDSDYDDIQQIRANSNRAASLTRQLLAFSRQQTLRPEVIQLPDVVSEISQLLKRLIGESIEFTVRHDRNLGPVRADPQQLGQVVMNLVVNARDAIAGQGTPQRAATGCITVTTRRIGPKDIRTLHSAVIPAGDYTALVVEDTGGGIPAAHLGKIFEPFFTTKEQGKGTGLGLSTVYGIVKQSGGYIFADNVEDAGHPVGARFALYLPVHHGAAPEPAPALPEEASDWAGGGRILLVEDEDMVRAVAERALVRAGYEVETAADGEEGLDRLNAAAQPFDLVLSDVVMPGMDGPAMVRSLRRTHAGLPVLFMSGYAEETLRRQIDLPDIHFIPKPFSVAEIGAKVAQVLAATRG